jgi:hypothetical protein
MVWLMAQNLSEKMMETVDKNCKFVENIPQNVKTKDHVRGAAKNSADVSMTESCKFIKHIYTLMSEAVDTCHTFMKMYACAGVLASKTRACDLLRRRTPEG